jgi:hypothetical protein
VAMIDAAVEDTCTRNLEEVQKLVLDDIYYELSKTPKLRPHLQFNLIEFLIIGNYKVFIPHNGVLLISPKLDYYDIFDNYDKDKDNIVTYLQFFNGLKTKCISVTPLDMFFLAKRYYTKERDEVYYK